MRSLFGQKDWLESMAEKWLTGSKHSQRLRKKKTDRPTNQPSAKLCPLFGNRQTYRQSTFGYDFWRKKTLLSISAFVQFSIHFKGALGHVFCAVRLCGGGVEMLHLLAIFVDLLHLRSAIQSKAVSVYRKAFFALRKAFVLYFDHFAKYFHYSSLFPYLHTERAIDLRNNGGHMMFIGLK